MMQNNLRSWVRNIVLMPILALIELTACSQSLKYNPAYLAAVRRPAETRVDANVLIYTSAMDDQYSFRGPPASLAGKATTTNLQLGSIVREAARTAFADIFRGEVATANSLDRAREYRVVVNPRPLRFSYLYSQFRNPGLAIRPIADLTAEVRVLDAKGDVVWRRQYASGEVAGPLVQIPGAPLQDTANLGAEEEINKVAHKAAYEVMAKAAADVANEIAGRGPRPGKGRDAGLTDLQPP